MSVPQLPSSLLSPVSPSLPGCERIRAFTKANRYPLKKWRTFGRPSVVQCQHPVAVNNMLWPDRAHNARLVPEPGLPNSRMLSRRSKHIPARSVSSCWRTFIGNRFRSNELQDFPEGSRDRVISRRIRPSRQFWHSSVVRFERDRCVSGSSGRLSL